MRLTDFLCPAEIAGIGTAIAFSFGMAVGRWIQWRHDAKELSFLKEVRDQLNIWEMSRD